MKVGELHRGMLLRPVAGMQWVKRRNTLCVEPVGRETYRFHYDPPTEMGTMVAMYVDRVPRVRRDKVTSLEQSWGARVVVVGGLLIAIDQSAWHRIEPVSK